MSRFIAAMDHSGGSSPGVLERYGYTNAHELPHEVVMDDIHLMRLRMVDNPDFNSDNISHAILYKDTVERGMVSVLNEKGIDAILKIDSGINSRGMLKDFPVEEMCQFALDNGCVGTKMRSVIDPKPGWDSTQNVYGIVEQQFEIAKQVYDTGLIPIVEPEINIHHEDKTKLEHWLHGALRESLDKYDGKCILKLTLPEIPEHYQEFTEHKKVVEVVGLSGGYSTEEACARLMDQTNMSASFSRALSEGLLVTHTDEEFNTKLSENIKLILKAL